VTTTWLKDEFLGASDNLPDPDIIAQEIAKTSKPLWNSLTGR
jgi:hypothetical protein